MTFDTARSCTVLFGGEPVAGQALETLGCSMARSGRRSKTSVRHCEPNTPPRSTRTVDGWCCSALCFVATVPTVNGPATPGSGTGYVDTSRGRRWGEAPLALLGVRQRQKADVVVGPQ